jgi:hypothetical protein
MDVVYGESPGFWPGFLFLSLIPVYRVRWN